MPDGQLSTLQEVVLDIVLDAYSSADAMLEDVKLLLGNGVSLAQVEAALVELREQRLVDAFVRHEGQSEFERYRRSSLKAGVAVWWHATDEGIRRHALM